MKAQKAGWRGTNMIGYCWWGRDTRGLAIGGVRCHQGKARLSQMMADDWVLPLAPLRLSVIIPNKAMPWALLVTSGSRDRYYSLMWVVALGYGWWPYQTSVLQDHAWQSVSWLLPLGRQSAKSTHQSRCNVLLLSRPILSSYCLLRPWFVC